MLTLLVTDVLRDVWTYSLENPGEFLAAFFGVLSVWYSRKNHILVYPTGIISVLLYVYICYMAKLYADAGLNFYYFIMSVIGWVNWSRKKEDDYVFPISYCSPKEWLSGTAVFLLTLVTLVSVLHHYTDSNTVIADSLVSAAAATAMWWMARRKIESWYAWTVSNLVAIPLFYIKGLHFTVAQYILFLVLAIWGYFTWKNEWNKEHAYRKT